MSMVKCKACGRHYNYEKEGCCPNCGAYNRPQRRVKIEADGSIWQVADSYVAGSMLGKECYEEKECYEQKECYENKFSVEEEVHSPKRIPRKKERPVHIASAINKEKKKRKSNPKVIAIVLAVIGFATPLLSGLETLFSGSDDSHDSGSFITYNCSMGEEIEIDGEQVHFVGYTIENDTVRIVIDSEPEIDYVDLYYTDVQGNTEYSGTSEWYEDANGTLYIDLWVEEDFKKIEYFYVTIDDAEICVTVEDEYKAVNIGDVMTFSDTCYLSIEEYVREGNVVRWVLAGTIGDADDVYTYLYCIDADGNRYITELGECELDNEVIRCSSVLDSEEDYVESLCLENGITEYRFLID